MLPRTIHRNFDVQMQVQENKDFPQILFGVNQEKYRKSITLSAGHEYEIELDPYGQFATRDFEAMSQEKRQCRTDHEIFPTSTHSVYTKANCLYDCHVHMAFQTCKCIPWDFVSNINDAPECDIFGLTCFFNFFEILTHRIDGNCTHCIDECNWIKYKKIITKKIPLTWKKIERSDYDYDYGGGYYYYPEYCNNYICINPAHR